MDDYDFVAIGDVTTDAFIELAEAEIVEHKKGKQKELCIPYGAKIPYRRVTVVPAVGNCANAAVAAARLGLSSALLSNHGDDDIAGRNLESLVENDVATDLLKSHPGMPSNYHYVILFEADRTILIKHHEYPYTLDGLGKASWLYVTSLGETSLDFHHEITKYLKDNPDTRLVLQPGTFQIRLGYDKLRDMYRAAEVFVCNVEEARKILEMKERDVPKLLREMHKRGPRIVCITDGPDGAYVLDPDTDEVWHMPIYPDPAPPLDRTGAGDAFASTFAIALAKGKSLQEALTWAPIASMSVVQQIGAQAGLPTEAELQGYLDAAPATYKAKKV